MNREIKFQIVSENKIIWYERITQTGSSIHWEWMNLELNPKNSERWIIGVYPNGFNYIRRQYTGLKDKNGKEIYEGDIVTFKTCQQGKESEFYEQKHTCVFYRGVFSIGSGHLYEWSHEKGGLDMPLKCRHYIMHGAKDMYMLDFDIEVIGNQYEHLELLKQKL